MNTNNKITEKNGGIADNPFSYQDDAIKNLASMKEEEFYSTLVAVPTGGGKTRIALRYLYEEVFNKPAGQKVLWLGERLNLLRQTKKSFEAWSEKPSVVEIEYFSSDASDYRDGFKAKTNFAIYTQQTLNNQISETKMENELEKWLENTETLTVVIDEAHHATESAYQNILYTLKNFQKNGKIAKLHIIGLTATPKSLNKSKDLNEIFFHGIEVQSGTNKRVCSSNTMYAYEISINDLIGRGVLSRPYIIEIGKEKEVLPDQEEVDKDSALLDKIVDVYCGGLSNLECWDFQFKKRMNFSEEFGQTIIFVNSRRQALCLEEKFRKKGVRCGVGISIDDKVLKPCDEKYIKRMREQANKDFDEFQSGNLKLLVSVDKLKEGIDVPKTQTVFIAKKFCEDVEYTQMVGRALRGIKQGGTKYAFIVHFGDNDCFDKIFWYMPESSTNNKVKDYKKDVKEHKEKADTEEVKLLTEEDDTIKSLAKEIEERLKNEVSNLTEEVKDAIIFEETLKKFSSVHNVPEGYYHFMGRYFIIWHPIRLSVEKMLEKIPEFVKNELTEVDNSLKDKAIIKEKEKLWSWFKNNVIKQLPKDTGEVYKNIVQTYLSLFVNFYITWCNCDERKFLNETAKEKYVPFVNLKDYMIPEVLWGYEKGRDEKEISRYLDDKWKELDPDTQGLWYSKIYFQDYFLPKLKRLNSIIIETEESEDEYFRLRLYREGRKRENLCTMIKQIIINGVDDYNKKTFVDVFGGTGTVTAQMDKLFKRRRVYNEYDAIVANFVDCVSKNGRFDKECIVYFDDEDEDLRKIIFEGIQYRIEELKILKNIGDFQSSIEDDDEIRKKETSIKNSIKEKNKEFKNKQNESDEKIRHKILRLINNKLKELYAIKTLLEDKKIASYIKAYLLWHEKSSEDIKKFREGTDEENLRKYLNDNSCEEPKGRLELAYKFILSTSFRSKKVSGDAKTGIDPKGIIEFRESIRDGWITELHKRLKGIKLYCKDFGDILTEKVQEGSRIYYFDPPYFLTKQYNKNFTDENHLKMLRWLRTTKEKWIFSCKSRPTSSQEYIKERTGEEDGQKLIKYKIDASENDKLDSDWLKPMLTTTENETTSLREYFRLFIYDEKEEDGQWVADFKSKRRDIKELFVYHGENPKAEYSEIMISNIKIPEDKIETLSKYSFIVESFEDFFQPFFL